MVTHFQFVIHKIKYNSTRYKFETHRNSLFGSLHTPPISQTFFKCQCDRRRCLQLPFIYYENFSCSTTPPAAEDDEFVLYVARNYEEFLSQP